MPRPFQPRLSELSPVDPAATTANDSQDGPYSTLLTPSWLECPYLRVQKCAEERCVHRRQRRPDTWRRHPWRAELAWVASVPTLSEHQVADLLAIDRWFALGPRHEALVVPVRIRSAEIFGNEKRLDDLVGSALFGPGRLTLELLRATRYPPPLAIERVSDGPDVLVVENVDPFWVAANHLRDRPGPIGRVAYGAGRSAQASIAVLGRAAEPPRKIWYWGDLDPEGVAIAAGVATRGRDVGLARVRPAATLWATMATCPIAEPGCHRWGGPSESWLGPVLLAATESVRAVGGCVRQEAVPDHVLEAALAELAGATA